MPGSSDSVLRLASDRVVWRILDGQVVALDLAASRYLSINRTGAAIWEDLAAGVTRDDMLNTLLARFDVERDELARDLDDFLAELRQRGLLSADGDEAER